MSAVSINKAIENLKRLAATTGSTSPSVLPHAATAAR